MSYNHSTKKILLIYIEPTPYILGLIRELKIIYSGRIDVLFLFKDLSQHWNTEDNNKFTILPKNKIKRLFYILKFFNNNKYNCIHLAGWGNLFFIFLIFYAKFKKMHVSIESDTPMPSKTKRWKHTVKDLVYPFIFNQIDLFLPGGKKQADYIKHYGIESAKIYPVQMTVDILDIKKQTSKLNHESRNEVRKSYKIKDDDIIFLFVGRLVKEKGLIDLISSFQQMKHQKSHLLIIGDGKMYPCILQFTKENTNIHCGGRLEGKKLIATYHAADVFVLPSYFEPWGLVINEAMAVGLPLIVSDKVGCNDDLIVNKENGLIFTAGCIEELTKALDELAGSCQRRKSMGIKSSKIIADWTLENEARKTCEAWNQLKHIS